MVFKRRVMPLPEYVTWNRRWSQWNKNQLPYQPTTGFDENAGEQLTLFDMDPDPEVLRQRILVEDSELTRYCAAIVADHARPYGWSVRRRNAVIQSLWMLKTLRPTPTAKVRASDVVALRRYDGTISSTLDVLAAAALLIEDVPTRVKRYFTAEFIDSGALPLLMRQHLQLWVQIMLGGSRRAPRQLPREPTTVELHIQGLAPVVQTWAEAGRQSFAEITKDDILAALGALPTDTSHRRFAENGPKSLFKILKGRRLIFANPVRGLDLTRRATNIPLRLDTAVIRAEPGLAEPRRRARRSPGGLPRSHRQAAARTAGDRHRRPPPPRRPRHPTAAPVRTRLAAWRDYRNQTWPASANPHLLFNRRTAHDSAPAAAPSPGRTAPYDHAPCARTASSTRSTPPAATHAASATSSGSASNAPPATS